MFAQKCPGQDMRYWTAEDVYEEKCPSCGEPIEFFKTDIRLRCPKCRTKVANPRFDMGCAQWCSYAEQCLGPGARGLKIKSIRLALEDELNLRANSFPEVVDQLKKAFKEAEELSAHENLDLPAVIAAMLALSLQRLGLIEAMGPYLEDIGEKVRMPVAAIRNAVQLAEKIAGGDTADRTEQTVLKLLGKIAVGQAI